VVRGERHELKHFGGNELYSANNNPKQQEGSKMKNVWMFVKKFAKEEEGMETVEYAVVGALVVAVGVGVWTALGAAIVARITELTAAVTTPAGS
jgi:pilus assembly protein Flp/PilA